MEAFGRMIAIITAVFLLLMLPVQSLMERDREKKQEYVKQLTETFAEEIRKERKISMEMYDDFLERINATGYLYKIDIMIGSKKQSSEKEEQSPGNEENAVTVWDTKEKSYLNMKYTEEVLFILYEEGSCFLKEGDYISISLCKKSGSNTSESKFVCGGEIT